jgi:indolepyruvate ferredoxin oxidoreductase
MIQWKILNGNEALIQGAREAGIDLYTGYPGSPLADFFNVLHESKKEWEKEGIRVVIANSEAHAAAMASGAKMAGKKTLIAMKSMGLHVASDALSVGQFATPDAHLSSAEKGGVVVVVGDDPWSISTSTPADSRYLFKHLHIPFLEPSTPQELKDAVALALELSQESSLYVGIVLTTFMAEGGGRVETRSLKSISKDLQTLNPSDFHLAQNVMVPPNSLGADKRMILERFPRYEAALKKRKLDKVYGTARGKMGIISSGATFEVLKQVMEDYNLLQDYSLLKLASSYPLVSDECRKFLEQHHKILIVEEKRGFLESQVKEYSVTHNLSLEICGKTIGSEEGFPAWGGLDYHQVAEGLKKAQRYWKLTTEPLSCEWITSDLSLTPPARLPTFCPGCPHRETLSLMKELREDLAQKNIQLLSHGDVGCYSLSFLAPFKEMHDLSAMGQGGALGAGTDLFVTNPSVVLMGDSTFFHSGMTAISNSVQMNHSITYILLDNDNTAMTGHQMTPRTGESVEGVVRPRQSLLDVAKALQVAEAMEVNPSDRYFYKNILSEFVSKPGVKVIVSTKECGLTYHGRLKKEEKKILAQETINQKTFVSINTFACEDCRVCVEMTGCPGLTQKFDAYGTKVDIDPQICVSDTYCTKLKACPSFELVHVQDYHPTKWAISPASAQSSSALTLSPPQTLIDLAQILHRPWRALVIGVGGSGVTTISRVIAEAALSLPDQFAFKFVDQKGLAQRNGSVSSHLSLYASHRSHGQTVPKNQADVIVAPDLLEGLRALDYLSSAGYLVVDADFQIPLSMLLDDGEKQKVVTQTELQQELRDKCGERLIMAPFKQICFERTQRSVYANAMILGVLFQKGLLPFDLESLQKAIARAIPKSEQAANQKAFEWGREWVLNPEAFNNKRDDENERSSLWLKSLKEITLPWQNPLVITNHFHTIRRDLINDFPFLTTEEVSQWAHDAIVYDFAKTYQHLKKDIKPLSQIPEAHMSQELKRLFLQTWMKTVWIKDEVFVAHLMISPLKKAQDQKRFSSLGKSFKIQRLNRPAFDVMGKHIEFDFSPREWMLKLMRHARFLRLLMPQWHAKERQMATAIREELQSILRGLTQQATLEKLPQNQEKEKIRERLMQLNNIKGYRQVRYKKAEQKKVSPSPVSGREVSV